MRAAVAAALLIFTTSPQARQTAQPTSWSSPQTAASGGIPQVILPRIDRATRLTEDSVAMDASKAADGAVEKRLRIAIQNDVRITPASGGAWVALADGSRLWRIAINAAGATDLRFGFAHFTVPDGVTLHVVDAAARRYDGAYSSADATPDGQLWLVPVAGDTLTLEVHVPAGVTLASDAIELTRVSAGYRNVTETGGPGLFGAGQSGTCNIDVVCPLGDPYRNDIRAVAKYYFDEPDGTYLCTGTLVNNAAQDDAPYFLTANHCISTQSAATSMSLIWNYQSPACGQHGGGSTAQTQEGGATLLAHRTDVDFSLVKLNTAPPSTYNVYFAGWDSSGDVPGGSIGIHHPSGWVKAITSTTHALTSMNSCIGTGGSQTHWRTGAPYTQGTTEGGSSGSAIVVPVADATGHDRLVIGTLSGGSAACSGSVPNTGYDCYGKLSVAWNGNSAGARLKDWLDPAASGVATLDGKNPGGASDRIFANGFE